MSVKSIAQSVSPKYFFEEIIAARVPAKLDNFDLGEFKFQEWTNTYLKAKCGDFRVRVEYREENKGRFGLGNESVIKFSEFLEKLENGEENLYLTTQNLNYTAEGMPSLTSPPVDGLVGDFPWNVSFMGNLIVQNCNLWMGCSSINSTSGLHHDYHDNLYILLRGTKKFILYNYCDAENLYPSGKIALVHPNGRINYEGQLTRAV